MSPSEHGHAKNYRPDIDGLRAIAVLSVIFFHLNPAILPGGFVGVDIFFVISGYLISLNILQEIDLHRFSIVEFYRRRVKRIAPAMLAVVAATLIAAQLLMLPEDAEQTAAAAGWSLVSLANVHFWLHQDASYFAAASHDQPLLHLWSLGVEEQFYLLWPALLLLTARLPRNLLFVGACLATAAGFLFAQTHFHRDPSFVYYMLPARAGELLLGAICAFAVVRGWRHSSIALPFAITGASLMCAPLFALDGDSVFPGFLAVPPTLGTALLIAAGHCGPNIVSRALSWKPAVEIGRVSYSAYLWHWPLIAFYRYGHEAIDTGAGVAILGATFVLAWLTFRFIEMPARRSTAPAPLLILRQFVVPAAVIGVASLAAMKFDGYAVRDDRYVATLQQMRNHMRPAYTYEYVCQAQTLTAELATTARCVLGTGSGVRTILWGDSNAAHYVGMLGAFADASGFRFRNLALGSCPPIFADPEPYVSARRLGDCRNGNAIARQAVAAHDVVIISADWLGYLDRSPNFLVEFFDTADQIVQDGKSLVIIGRVPIIEGYDRRCMEKALSYPGLECPRLLVRMPEAVMAVNRKLRDFADAREEVEYFEATAYLCDDDGCSSHDNTGTARYYDPSHLTMTASWELGRAILRQDGVPSVFQLAPSDGTRSTSPRSPGS